MSFDSLYQHIQQTGTVLKRTEIHALVEAMSGVGRIKVLVSEMDTENARGLYISATNLEHPSVKQFGCNIILIARSLNYCWRRFVWVKELMHAFDSGVETTSSASDFEGVLEAFSSPGGGSGRLASPMKAEVKAFWRALAVICPETIRQELLADRNEQRMTDYQIALRLKIPEAYVSRLLSPSFQKNLDA